MELGELVNVAMPALDDEAKCPFAHEQPKTEGKNERGGIGTKLATNLTGRLGGHNGVWLPGNYAVGGGAGGVDIWKARGNKKRKLSGDETADIWEDSLDLTEEEWISLSTPDSNEEEEPEASEVAAALMEALAK